MDLTLSLPPQSTSGTPSGDPAPPGGDYWFTLADADWFALTDSEWFALEEEL